MREERLQNLKLNNLYLQDNLAQIRSEAPIGAMCVIVDNQKVFGYYENWIDATDAYATKIGAVWAEL